MYLTFNVELMSALVLALVVILEGVFYENTLTDIPKRSVVRRFSGVTKTSCVHRCRGNVSCHQAAIQGSDCLFLRDGAETTNEDDEMMGVTLLKKMRKLLGKI